MKPRQESFLQRLADCHPFVFLLYHIHQGKFKPTKNPSDTAKSQYRNASYHENDHLLAEVSHYNELPVLQIYTHDTAVKATIKGQVTAKAMIDFYLKYVQYLPYGARMNTHTYFKNPLDVTNNDIFTRALNFESMHVELHHLLLEFNQAILSHNDNVSFALQLPLLTLDDLRMMIVMCDVYKGMACSAAVFSDKDANYLVRNLDWTPLNVLGNHTLATLTLTEQRDPAMPRAVFSLGLTPGVLGLSVANDKGLVITLNEATKNDTKRINENKNAVPQFILVRQLIEHCCTVQDVKNYLKRHQPATSHILTVMDAEGSKGVFEMLPNKGPFSKELFRFRGIDNRAPYDLTQAHPRQHVSNHFLDKHHLPIKGSEGFACSFDRYDWMEKALYEHKTPMEVAQSTSVEDTVHTLIFKHHKGELSLSINIANGYSADAVNTHGKVDYTGIPLSTLFKEFLQKAEKISQLNFTESVLTAPSEPYISMLACVDIEGSHNIKVGRLLSKLYSDVMQDQAKDLLTQRSYYSELQRKQMLYSTIGLFHELAMTTSQRDQQKKRQEYLSFMQSIESDAAKNHRWQLTQVTAGMFVIAAADVLSTYATGSASVILRALTALGQAYLKWPTISVLATALTAVTGKTLYDAYCVSFFQRLMSDIPEKQFSTNQASGELPYSRSLSN